MKLKDIETPVSSVSGVGPALEKLLAKVDVFTISDLLSYWPRDFEDRTRHIPLASWKSFPKVHTIAQVINHSWFGYGRMKTLRVIIDDGTAQGALICFNRPFLEKSLPVGSVIAVTGAFTLRYGELQSTAFEASCIDKNNSIDNYRDAPVPGSAVLPVYPLTAGLTQAQIRKVMAKALKEYGKGIEDEIPEEIIEKRSLMHKMQAVASMHQPKSLEEALLAKKTLVYEELYSFQKVILERSEEHRRIAQSAQRDDSPESFENSLSPLQKQLLARLPFSLTTDQKHVITEINSDIDLSHSEEARGKQVQFRMARLLQGDVGSGKTLVAFFAALRTIDYGGQCALLAPTEILARQHAENAAKMLEPLGVTVAFLTGNLHAANRAPLLAELKKGGINIIIGTHALFSQSVQYKNLRFVLIDEQHRFGVVQRNAILDKGRQSLEQKALVEKGEIPQPPDFMLMSATPIPQTLAHTVFGDLDVSVIKTMPAGRKTVITHLTRQGNEARVYEAVRKELAAGRQAYFVYPLIEKQFEDEEEAEYKPEVRQIDAPGAGLKSAEEMFMFLSQQVYPEFKCALVHSRVEEDEQSRILTDFRDGKINILIATSVVEVGVDVPNATCMVIEHADRFGLAALHQLRGRVGRGAEQSQCFLIYSEKLSELGKARLKVLHETTDGFVIAEEDLKLRGPGDVNGIQQSGYFTLGIADPVRDKAIMEEARADILRLKSS